MLAFTDPGAALSKLWKGFFGETGIFAWMWDDGIKPFFTWIGEKFVGMGKAIAEKWNTAFPDGILSWIWDNTIGALYTLAKDFLSTMATSISKKWNEAFPDGILSWIWDNTLGALYTFAKDFFGNMATSIAEKWNEIFPNGILSWIWDNTFGGLYTWASNHLGNIGDAIAEKWNQQFPNGIAAYIYDNTIGGLVDWFKDLANIDFGAVFTKMIAKIPGGQKAMDFFGFGGSSKKTTSSATNSGNPYGAENAAMLKSSDEWKNYKNKYGLTDDDFSSWRREKMRDHGNSLDPVVVTALRPTSADAAAALSGNLLGGPGVDGVPAPVVASFGGQQNSQDIHIYQQAPAGASDGHTDTQKRFGRQGLYSN